MPTKPLQPAGMHDLDPAIMLQREYIIDILKKNFKQYGFLPIETPAIEHLDILHNKYGEESDKLLFKILNSGNFLSKTTEKDYHQGHQTLLPKITHKGLRYDLTIPLTRYLATHKNTLTLPFKRFQIQPVWRAEKPQKNRYREFYQCDLDIIGNNSLICEAEIIAMIYQIATQLKLPDTYLQINHRFIFKALASQIQAPQQETTLCRTLDKLDKIGTQKVIALLYKQGFTTQQIERINWIFSFSKNLHKQSIQHINHHIGHLPPGKKAVSDLQQIHHYIQTMQLPQTFIKLTPTLARGLDYYTGPIFELKTSHTTTSLGGGGRYDNLATLFNLNPTPSIGFSFGLDRLHNTLKDHHLLPPSLLQVTSVLIIPLALPQETTSLQYLHQLHKHNIPTEIYPAGKRLHKALNYANKKNIPWIAIIGEEEQQKFVISLKNMITKSQKTCKIEQAIKMVKST